MSVTFLHTADWQLGKPFARIEDVQKRSLVQHERIAVIQRIGKLAKERQAQFILVAGDLFDSTTASKATVSAACSAIGQLGLPVLAIPGNHDHGGPGSLWEQDFFLHEQTTLAPNFHVLLKPEPFELEGAVIFPCPLLRRADACDTTEWLRAAALLEPGFSGKPRIVLAHGSTQLFTSQSDEEEAESSATNFLQLERLPEGAFDYIALGDWHGAKEITPKAWYSGTPELDRFQKGGENDPGNVLVVEASRGGIPKVEKLSSARFGWRQFSFDFADDNSLSQMREQIAQQIGARAGMDLLRLSFSGSLGITAATELEKFLESLEARLLRLKLDNQTVIAPTEQEIQGLTQRVSDPLIASVAAQLVARAAGTTEEAAVARIALRELHAACAQP